MVTAFKRIELRKNWLFRQAGDNEHDDLDSDSDSAWMPVARVPTNVHLDLLANGKYVSFLAYVFAMEFSTILFFLFP